jgi:tape measure domain-containing protein
MTTIAALNVRLGMDASNFSQGVNLARNEVSKVSQILRDTIPAHIKMRRELDLLEKAFSKSGQQTKTYAAAVQTVIDKYTPLTAKYKAAAAAQKELEKAQAEAAAKAARTAAEGQRLTLAMLSAQERHNRSVSEYNRLLKAGAIDHVTYRRAIEQSKKSLEGINSATVAGTTATGEMLGKLKILAATYLGFQTITKSIKLATEVEDATVAFEVLTGSVNDGKVLFDQIRRFAAESPVTFSNAAQAARTLMSFGVEAQRIEPTLRMMSDVVGGNNERFKMLSLAFAQMSAAGRLMGQDLLQMINAGFNPLMQIAKDMAKQFGGLANDYMPGLKKSMEEGEISAERVSKAFADATAEGGMFNGMTERLAETMGGKLNIALSDLEKAGAAAGQAIAPLVIAMTDGFSESNSVLNGMVFTVEKFADGVGLAAAMAKDLYTDISTLSLGTTEATDKFLDMIRLRDMRRSREQENQGEGQFETQANQAAAAQALTEKQRKARAEAAEAEKKQQAELAKQHAKTAADRIKEIEKIRKASEAAFTRDVENALAAAKAHFASQKKADQDRRDQITKGPQAADVGSAEAARIIAEQRNAQLANRMVPQRETTQEELVAKTKELLIAQAAEAKRQAELLIAVKAATAAMLDTRPKLFRG